MAGGFGTQDEFFEALTLLQTIKVYPLPLKLYGKEYWWGLLDWMRRSMPGKGRAPADDFKFITMTDDTGDAADTTVIHRLWKESQISKDSGLP
jgi:predicted Rossmann-fold nucleotide-binding protein